jgi:hypothetical protein
MPGILLSDSGTHQRRDTFERKYLAEEGGVLWM